MQTLVTSAPCASIQANVSPQRLVQLSGFIGSEEELGQLRKAISALSGVQGVQSNVQLRPWPQCEVLLNFDHALAQQQGLAVELKGGKRQAGRTDFVAGDAMSIEITSPAYPSYLYVSYLQTNGDVVHLSWPAGRFPKATLPNTRITFGGGANGQPTFRVGAPFGDEVVVVVASASPLFPDTLPARSNDRDYLTAFRRAFALQPKTGGQRVVNAVMAPLLTSEK